MEYSVKKDIIIIFQTQK